MQYVNNILLVSFVLFCFVRAAPASIDLACSVGVSLMRA